MVINAAVFERIGLEYVKSTPSQLANINHCLSISDEQSVAQAV